MADILYIQAADLRLGSPVTSLDSQVVDDSQIMLKSLTYIAFERLVKLCELLRPRFLLLQGTIYTPQADCLKARLAMQKACVRLADNNIPVFIFPDRDPQILSQLAAIDWPANTTIVGDTSETFILENDDKPVIMIHSPGLRPSVSSKLPISRSAQNCFQLGLLPSSYRASILSTDFLATLENMDMDAWAIAGTIHKILSEKPFICSSGCLQGLSSCEKGPAGCMVMYCRQQENKWQFKPDFKPIASLQWEDVNIVSVSKNYALEKLIREKLDDLRANVDNNVSTIIAQIILSEELWPVLPNLFNINDNLYDELKSLRTSSPSILIKLPLFPQQNENKLKNILSREDLTGEIARLTDNLLSNPSKLKEFSQQITSEIYNNPHAASLVPFDESQQNNLLLEAQSLCQYLLERH